MPFGPVANKVIQLLAYRVGSYSLENEQGLCFEMKDEKREYTCLMSTLYISHTFGIKAEDLKTKFEEWLNSDDEQKFNTELEVSEDKHEYNLILNHWFPESSKAQTITLKFCDTDTLLLEEIRGVKEKATENKDQKLETLCTEYEALMVAGQSIPQNKLKVLYEEMQKSSETSGNAQNSS
jgi:hypothetical protein